MCGIVAAAARSDVSPFLIEGLKALEYRGYDSAGVALVSATGLQRLRTKGKVRELERLHAEQGMSGCTGIAHTRWATHGAPVTENAHPMISRDSVAVVHNGIIENHVELRAKLVALGFEFSSETDTEVIAHLIEHLHGAGLGLRESVLEAVKHLKGAYAIAVISRREPGCIVGARRGSPMVVGLADGEFFIASDTQALLSRTQRFIYLADGNVAEISSDGVRIFDEDGNMIERPVRTALFGATASARGTYRHYMLKEIHEQPQAIADTIDGRIVEGKIVTESFGPGAESLFRHTRNVHLVACGSSYHAAMVARYWIEGLAGIACNAEIASEFRYRDAVVPSDTLFVSISQSGETADTLMALKLAKSRNYLGTLAICNVAESSLTRESQLTLLTRAGPEIGVASTKAFTTQLVALAMLSLELARSHGIGEERYERLVRELELLPSAVSAALGLDIAVERLAQKFSGKQHALFLGRGTHYPIAMEGALKLKEISYIHAEAYPAG